MAERTFVWCENLQYTLLLLIQFLYFNTVQPYIHLQYTLLLLIHLEKVECKGKIVRFTIHFATINTNNLTAEDVKFLNLQYTLLLLILSVE